MKGKQRGGKSTETAVSALLNKYALIYLGVHSRFVLKPIIHDPHHQT